MMNGTTVISEDRILYRLDAVVLERALREASKGSMTAPLPSVVRLAIDKWGFPGSIGRAKALLLESGLYEMGTDPTTSEPIILPRGLTQDQAPSVATH